MKYLLTSAGVTNNTIADELERLVGKPREKIKVGYIVTATMIETGNKNAVWFLGVIDNIINHGFEWIDLIDIANSDIDWQERLDEVDVVFVGGGNTFYLQEVINRVSFKEYLITHQDKVYVGSSAGSIVVTPDISIAGVEPADKNTVGLSVMDGMNLVDFEVSPHSDDVVKYESIEVYTTGRDCVLYAIDDQSAISVENGKVSYIGESEWKKFNN